MGSPNLRRITAPLVCVAIVVGILGGCRPAQVREPAILAVSGPRTHPADRLELAARLPDDCLVYLSAESLNGFFEAIGRDTIARRFAEPWERAVFEIVRETGLDPLSLGGLERMGVDVEGQLGFALLSGRDAAVAIAVTLADPERFKVALYEAMPGGRQRPRVIGDVVLIGDDDLTVAIDDQLAIVVVGDDADRHASELVLRDPEASLSHHRPFRVAMRQLRSAPLIRGWADPRGMAYVAFGLDPRWAGATFGEAMEDISAASERAMKAARERGASAEELVAIDEHFAAAQEQLRGDDEAARLRRLIGDVAGAAVALDISEDGVRARVRIEAADDALVKRLWSNRPGAPRVIGVLDRAPLIVMALSVAPEVLVDGLAVGGLDADLRAAADVLAGGVTIDDLLTGELELAITPPADGALTASLERLEGAATLGVRDVDRVRGILDELSGVDGSPLERREGGWRLVPPDLPTVDLTLTDERLVLATDATVTKRLIDGSRGSYQPSRALSLLGRGDDALSFGFAVGLPIVATTRGTAVWSSSSRGWKQGDAVAPSEAYLAKKAELDAVDRLIADQMVVAQQQERRRVMDLVSSLGHLAARLRTTAHGLELELRYQVADGPLVDAVADVLQVERGVGGEQMRRLEMLWAARDALEAELDAIGERDRAGDRKKRRVPASKSDAPPAKKGPGGKTP